jgi:hypothetical protein
MKVYKSPWISRESYFVKTGEEGVRMVNAND